MTSKVLPLLIDRPDRQNPAYTILNSGSIRFDIFKGPFTRNDQVGLTFFRTYGRTLILGARSGSFCPSVGLISHLLSYD